jgi:uncharacterized protein YqgV (UPF0045/DUF77 family)
MIVGLNLFSQIFGILRKPHVVTVQEHAKKITTEILIDRNSDVHQLHL